MQSSCDSLQQRTAASRLENGRSLMKKVIATLMLLVSVSANGQFTIFGSVNCGSWLDARKTRSSNLVEVYIAALVDGMSLGSGTDIWTALGVRTTPVQLNYWMDVYCAKNPLSDVLQGVSDFANEKTKDAFKRRFQR